MTGKGLGEESGMTLPLRSRQPQAKQSDLRRRCHSQTLEHWKNHCWRQCNRVQLRIPRNPLSSLAR